jgi:2-amino-4-hydroxy-6-hydroxymethyldihydropteridine diphosphokinase
MAAEARVYVGIGSNLGDRVAHVTFASRELHRLPRTRLVALSPWFRSAPVGPGTQGDYLNGVAELRSSLPPDTLLQHLQRIEKAAGRVRTQRWGARTLDLDLLLHGYHRQESQRLTLPHPRIAERNFVVFPLCELAPSLRLPDGNRLQSLRARLGTKGLLRIGMDPGAFDAAA